MTSNIKQSLMKVYDDRGRPLDATFSVKYHGKTVSIFFESRGGRKGASGSRNTDYNSGLEVLLRRASEKGAILITAELASQKTATLSTDERLLRLQDYPYPINLPSVHDIVQFRRILSSAQAKTGRTPSARGPGNATKRIRLEFCFPNNISEGIENTLAGLSVPDQHCGVNDRKSGWDSETKAEEVVDDIIRPKVHGSSQGTGLDASSRRAVELAAMELAKKYYEKEWSCVDDVSATAPYDLICSSESGQLRVEVKGTTGLGEKVLLTYREVESARKHYPDTALFVVSQIELDCTGLEPTASGGVETEIKPWYPQDDALVAITYRYEV